MSPILRPAETLGAMAFLFFFSTPSCAFPLCSCCCCRNRSGAARCVIDQTPSTFLSVRSQCPFLAIFCRWGNIYIHSIWARQQKNIIPGNSNVSLRVSRWHHPCLTLSIDYDYCCARHPTIVCSMRASTLIAHKHSRKTIIYIIIIVFPIRQSTCISMSFNADHS